MGESLGEPRVDSALNIFEMSGAAWALTVHKAAGASNHGPEADFAAYRDSILAGGFPALDPEEMESAEAELGRAGIVDADGAVSPQWVLAARIATSAPVRAAAVVQSDDTSVHTDLALAGGRGVGVTYARRIRHTETGVDVIEVRNAVEISFLAEEDAWAALKRHLPVVADAPGPSEIRADPPGASAAGTAYTIHLEVSAHPQGSLPDGPLPAAAPAPVPPAYAGRDIWVLADRLYSVSSGPAGDSPALKPVSPAAISQGFAWRLLGAREYLASVAERQS